MKQEMMSTVGDYFSDIRWLEQSEPAVTLPETTRTDIETQTAVETQTETEKETRTAVETQTETEKETQTAVETQTETEKETRTAVEIQTETEKETRTAVETQTETEKETRTAVEIQTGTPMRMLSQAVWEAENRDYLTVDEVARKLNVSTKTISRWRKQGLESEIRLIASRNRVVILVEKLNAFIASQPVRVEKGRKFSQMTPTERTEIIDRAARMAAAGRKLTEVIHLLAQNTGRSAETIRYTLKNHDAHHPKEAIFPKYQRTLDDREKRQLLDDFRSGMKMDTLSARYERTKTSIYRIVAETRANLILAMNLEFIPSPETENVEECSDEERVILDEMPRNPNTPRRPRLPGTLPSYLASLYTVPLLTFEQEQHLFRKMNYLKMRAFHRREQLNPTHPSGRLMEMIENDFAASNEVKNQLVSANLRLVVSIAKRHTGSSNNLFDLISDGNMSLIRAVEKFDYSRKNRFSTYASWAIMKNYTRAVSDEQRYYKKFITLENETNIEREEEVYDPVEFERTQTRQQKRVAEVLKCLTPREQQIIIRRFGLNRDHPPMTLKQVGQELGVTKERIRQIEILALSKLKQMNPVMPDVQ